MDAHLPRPGWRGEGLGLPTEQGTLTSLRTGEGVGGGLRGVGGTLGDGRRQKFLIKLDCVYIFSGGNLRSHIDLVN